VVEVDIIQHHCQQLVVLVEVMVAIPQRYQQLLVHLVKDLQGAQ
jgi:Holliday junction resolvase-like predicted endonuclease